MSVVYKGSNQLNGSASGTTATLGYTITTTGSMLIVFSMMNYAALTGISDSKGNVWTKLTDAVPGGGSLYYCLTNGAGATTVTTSGASGTYQICIAEYTGAVMLSSIFATQSSGFGTTSPVPINCGPVTTTIGALIFIDTYQQATSYVSTSGSTNRTTVSGQQGFFADNLSATGLYTETGTASPNAQFGGGASVFAFTNPSPTVPNMISRPSYGSGRGATFGRTVL